MILLLYWRKMLPPMSTLLYLGLVNEYIKYIQGEYKPYKLATLTTSTFVKLNNPLHYQLIFFLKMMIFFC